MNQKNGDRAIAVMVVAASAVRRAGLESLIQNSPGLKLAGSLLTALRLEHYARELQPDLILVDVEQSEASFPDFPESLNIPLIVLVDDPDSQWIAQALRSGVKAILPRDSELNELLPAFQASGAGLVLMDAQSAQTLAADIRSRPQDSEIITEDLTPREVEVLAMLAEGLRNRQMAERLGISEHTVKFHVSSIFEKLGASSRTESIALGVRRGLIFI